MILTDESSGKALRWPLLQAPPVLRNRILPPFTPCLCVMFHQGHQLTRQPHHSRSVMPRLVAAVGVGRAPVRRNTGGWCRVVAAAGFPVLLYENRRGRKRGRLWADGLRKCDGRLTRLLGSVCISEILWDNRIHSVREMSFLFVLQNMEFRFLLTFPCLSRDIDSIKLTSLSIKLTVCNLIKVKDGVGHKKCPVQYSLFSRKPFIFASSFFSG